MKVRTKGSTLAPGLPLAKRSYIEYLINDAFFPREERYYLKKAELNGHAAAVHHLLRLIH